jgi:peptidoglycan hydrolase CwlO-like protein
MSDAIIVAVLSLVGTFAGSFSGMKLMSYRIEQLEKKVDRYATITEKIPVIEEQIKSITHRVEEIERKIDT